MYHCSTAINDNSTNDKTVRGEKKREGEWVLVYVFEKERDWQRYTEREREREIQTKRQSDRQRETDRETDIQTDRQTDRHTLQPWPTLPRGRR